MARLKKEHSGWRSSGLWTKYKYPSLESRHTRLNKKKDTNAWCRGKKGREHDLVRRQDKCYCNDSWHWTLVRAICKNCNKEIYSKRQDYSIPMHLYIEHEWEVLPIQVKVNGQSLIINPARYRTRDGLSPAKRSYQ